MLSSTAMRPATHPNSLLPASRREINVKRCHTAQLRALVERGIFLELPAAIERATVEKIYHETQRGGRQ